jgi:CRP-like cAMP-binding protein
MIKNSNHPSFAGKLQQPFYQPFLQHMAASVPVDEEAKALLTDHCELVSFEKGDRLLNVGNAGKFIYFIISGECISYYTDPGGKTTTWFFHYNQPESTVKNLFAVDYKSFLSGSPATISIDALSPVTALRFSVNDVHALTEGSRSIERWLRLMNESAYIQTYDRISTLLTLTAPERYEKLLATEPHLKAWLMLQPGQMRIVIIKLHPGIF